LALRKPFIQYGTTLTALSPGVPDEQTRTPQRADVRRHTAGSGKTVKYGVSKSAFIETVFTWQTEALRTSWLTFWNDWAWSGKPFVYIDGDNLAAVDDNVHEVDDTIAGAGVDITTGATHSERWVTIEQDELSPERGQVAGYYDVFLQMREVV
jgi:hypothetical protein